MEKFIIFLTVGTQLKFDRLVKYLEEYSLDKNNFEIIYQVGIGGHKPSKGKVYEKLSEKEFNAAMSCCDIVVSHAGIGTIVSALSLGKKIIIVPRSHSHGEHRNDHQHDTARKLSSNILTANSFSEFKHSLNIACEKLKNSDSTSLDPNIEFANLLDKKIMECLKSKC